MRHRRRTISLIDNNIAVDEKTVEWLKRRIVIAEGNNLKTREKNDNEMISWIKKLIEEKIKCYLSL